MHGITHLLAVSGSNVSYIIIATKFIFDKIFGKKISNYFCIITIIIFMLVSGASASVVRASLMAIILILSEIFLKKSNTIISLALSAFILLLTNPFIICDVGFLLSFGGTIGIVLFNSKINDALKKRLNMFSNKIINSIIEVLSVSLSAQILIIPIMWYYFNTISIISIFTNLFAVPLSGIISILIMIIYILGLVSINIAQFISYPTYIMISILIYISKIFGSFSFSNITLITPSIFTIIIYYLIAFYAFYKNGLNKYIKKLLYFALAIYFTFLIFKYIVPRNYV